MRERLSTLQTALGSCLGGAGKRRRRPRPTRRRFERSAPGGLRASQVIRCGTSDASFGTRGFGSFCRDKRNSLKPAQRAVKALKN